MSSPLSPPKPPVGGDMSTGTFEQVLFAVTGFGPDLHAILDGGETAGAGWFIGSKTAQTGGVQADGQVGGSGYSYNAWDKWYIAVDRDPNKPSSWDTGVGDIDELVTPLNAGKLGLMDVNRLRDAKIAVDNYATWLATNHETIQQWVNKLTSDDSAFKGKAAHAIRENLTKIASTIDDLHTQITVERKTPESLQTTADALMTFAKGMANVWSQYSGALNYLVTNTMTAVVQNVHTYIVGKGLAHGTPNYVLDILVSDSRERAEAYITEVVNGYSSDANSGPLYTVSWHMNGGNNYAAWSASTSVSQTGTYNFTPSPLPEGFPVLSGPLGSQGTWDTFNKHISAFVRKKLEPLDTQARTLVAELQSAYERTKKPLEELETPITLPPGGSGNNNPFGNFPPPGGNLPPPGGNIPPPGGGGDIPPPGGTGNIPPPGGTGNIPPPGGTGNVPPPGGTGNNPPGFTPPGGSGEVPPPGGTFGNQPPGGGPFDTNLFGDGPPPGGESSNNPPNGNGPVVPPPVLPPAFSNSPPNARSGPGGTGLVDENGNPIDANGNLVDANGNPIDEFGNPIDPANGTAGNQPPGMSNLGLDDLGEFPGGSSDPGGDFNSQSGEFGNSPPGGDLGDFPGGDSNLPGDLPGGESNRSGDFSNLPNDFSNFPNDQNGDFSNLPGDVSNQPPGGTSNLPDFSDLPGGGSGDFGNLPGGGGGAGGGAPGGTSNLPDFGNMPGGGGGAGGGAPGGDFSNLPGGGGAAGGGGAGSGFGGEGWSDWSGQGPDTQDGGAPFGGTTSGQPHGGMPMMPPMMPPMNGGQGDSKERERQTWLSEDDKIWGTDSDAGVGIIGLPNDVSFESEEPLAPTHVHVSSAAPRGKPTEQQAQQAAEQTATS